MKPTLTRFLLLQLLFGLTVACRPTPTAKPVADMMWDEIEANALGQHVKLLVSRDNADAVKYLNGSVSKQLLREYGIRLTLVSPPANDTAPLLHPPPQPDPDLVWMDLDAFHQYRRSRLLQPALAAKIPNARYIDWRFFGPRIESPTMERSSVLPWGKNPLVLVYNRDNVAKVPTNLRQLAAWIRENPGRFTIHRGRGGYRMLHSWLKEVSMPDHSLPPDFSEKDYTATRDRLAAFIEELRPYLWMEGKHFPKDAAELNLLFMQGKVDFSIHEVYPARRLDETPVRFRIGTRIWPCPEALCTHFLGVPADAANKEGALVVLNYLLSPEAQLNKGNALVWGDGSVLDMEKLPEHWRKRFLAQDAVDHQGASESAPLMTPHLAMEYWVRMRHDFQEKLKSQP
ncbi:extracellular solute-binding protein [Acanthopleuribacter pedis]|uniref:Extracellular solute-binding protein n=1 Tax=Acanthopleuribacter pedis TaxID=442870 RepID=A0A8J7QNN9_9BACT|nr:extracellular solute-binding protein [Acanthopleuribacter pedis]MBO1322460.1 extracellular solute-binding protein [Acanthopleuribacter pedis]